MTMQRIFSPRLPALGRALSLVALFALGLAGNVAWAQDDMDDLASELYGDDESSGEESSDDTDMPDIADTAEEPASEPEAEPEIEEEKTEGAQGMLEDRIRAVSRKTFLKRNRFTLAPQGGVTTNDAFFRRWVLGGRGSYHLADSFALDIGGGYNLVNEELGPTRVLRKNEDAPAITDDARYFGYADVGATFSPIYGKFALFDDWVIHFDGFASGGVGAMFTSNESILGPGFPGMHPAMEVGVGTRIFLLDWLVIRADLRDYIYPQDRNQVSTLQNMLFLNIGVGFYFPFGFDYEYQAYKVVG
jgi:outer membrane beta-barrel protein